MTHHELGQDYAAAAVLSLGRVKCKRMIREVFRRTSEETGVRFGPIRFAEGVHQVEGPVMIGEARCVALPRPSRMTDDLRDEDLALLRDKTRAAHARAWPNEPPFTDAECDDIINAIGPGTAGRVAKETVH